MVSTMASVYLMLLAASSQTFGNTPSKSTLQMRPTRTISTFHLQLSLMITLMNKILTSNSVRSTLNILTQPNHKATRLFLAPCFSNRSLVFSQSIQTLVHSQSATFSSSNNNLLINYQASTSEVLKTLSQKLLIPSKFSQLLQLLYPPQLISYRLFQLRLVHQATIPGL